MYVAEALGYMKVLPAYLSPNLKQEDLIHGVSFASAASGYDDLTANFSVRIHHFFFNLIILLGSMLYFHIEN